MDVVQVASAAISVAEVSWRLGRRLVKFIENAKRAPETASELCAKCQRLHETLQVVRRTYLEGERRWQQHRPYKWEAQAWLHIRESLKSGQNVLRQFEKELRPFSEKLTNRQELTWVEKALLQLKLDKQEDRIRHFERHIDDHFHIMRLSMDCINSRNYSTLSHTISMAVSYLVEASAKGHSTALSGKVSQITSSRPVQECIELAETVKEEVKKTGTDQISQLFREPSRSEPFLPIADATENSNHVIAGEGDGDDPDLQLEPGITWPELTAIDPVIDDRLPPELLDVILQKYEIDIAKETTAAHDDIAEKYLRQRLMFLEEGSDSLERQKQRETCEEELAEVLKKLGRTREAQVIYSSLDFRATRSTSIVIPERETVPQQDLSTEILAKRSRWSYELAKLQFSDLNGQTTEGVPYAPEKYARQSVMLAWQLKNKQDVVDSLSDAALTKPLMLLYDIWKANDKIPAAEVLKVLCSRIPMPPESESLAQLAASLLTLSRQDSATGSTTSVQTHSTPVHSPQPSLYEDINHYHKGNTPLITAIKDQYNQSVKACLDQGAAVELKCQDPKRPRTPLLHAVESADERIVDMLVKRRANIDSMDSGTTALHHAIAKRKPAIVSLLLQLGADKEICEPANPSLRVPGELTPLTHAVAAGCPTIVRTLLDHGANPVAAPGEEMKTPLHKAVDCDDEIIAKILIEKGGSSTLEAEDGNGRTPLRYAIEQPGRFRLVQLFVNSRAVVDDDLLKEAPKYMKKWIEEELAKRRSGVSGVPSNASTRSGSSRWTRVRSSIASSSSSLRREFS